MAKGLKILCIIFKTADNVGIESFLITIQQAGFVTVGKLISEDMKLETVVSCN